MIFWVVALSPPGPDQAKVAGLALVPAATCTEVVLQVNDPLGVALAVGGVVFPVTMALAVLVQPFTVLVTVTVYVPAQLTLGLGKVWLFGARHGPLHR